MAQFFSNTLVLVALYALLGSGFVIVYRSSRVLNFAHGELMMLGGYFAFVLASPTDGNMWIAVPIALFFSFAAGAAIYFLAMYRMVGQPLHAAIIVTIGLSILLRGIATLVWGGDLRYLTAAFNVKNSPHTMPWGAKLATFDLAIIAAAAFYLLFLFLFFQRSKLGFRMRAAAEAPLLASQRGINIYFLFALSWSLATFGASLGGILYGANNFLTPEIGVVGLAAFAVPLVGGMDSLKGVIPGAVMVGFSQNIAMRYFDPKFASVAPMILLLIVLLTRPWGLWGTKEEIERV
ncbi:MAG: branched-chain amino acid ABC transporter permease [Chloroflexi bacterium]|nr:branched-chain amino acid ABC transporter permease [Chloroflexota bacterium]